MGNWQGQFTFLIQSEFGGYFYERTWLEDTLADTSHGASVFPRVQNVVAGDFDNDGRWVGGWGGVFLLRRLTTCLRTT